MPRITTRLRVVLVFVTASQPIQSGKLACPALQGFKICHAHQPRATLPMVAYPGLAYGCPVGAKYQNIATEKGAHWAGVAAPIRAEIRKGATFQSSRRSACRVCETPWLAPATESRRPAAPSLVPAMPCLGPAAPSTRPVTPSVGPATTSVAPAAPSLGPETQWLAPETPSLEPETPWRGPRASQKWPQVATESRVPRNEAEWQSGHASLSLPLWLAGFCRTLRCGRP